MRCSPRWSGTTRCCEPAVDAHGGYLVKTTGDGVHAAFDRAGDALAAAVAMQQALAAEPWPAGAPVKVRIGVPHR